MFLPGRPRVFVAGAALALLLPLTAHADAARSYKAALEAIEAGDWATAARQLEAAIAEQAQEKKRMRLYGMVFVPYLPHYQLGRVRLELGDCSGALAALQISENQGVVQETAEFARLLDLRKRCGGGAQGRVEAPRPMAQEPTAQQLPPATAETVLPPPAATVAATVPPPPSDAAEPAPSTSKTLPAGLKAAAREYFAGRYQEALDRLAMVPRTDPKVAAQSHLFEAAAHFALYRRSGAVEAARLTAARAAASECRKIDRALKPDPAAFSPAFLSFFNSAR